MGKGRRTGITSCSAVACPTLPTSAQFPAYAPSNHVVGSMASSAAVRSRVRPAAGLAIQQHIECSRQFGDQGFELPVAGRTVTDHRLDRRDITRQRGVRVRGRVVHARGLDHRLGGVPATMCQRGVTDPYRLNRRTRDRSMSSRIMANCAADSLTPDSAASAGLRKWRRPFKPLAPQAQPMPTPIRDRLAVRRLAPKNEHRIPGGSPPAVAGTKVSPTAGWSARDCSHRPRQ